MKFKTRRRNSCGVGEMAQWLIVCVYYYCRGRTFDYFLIMHIYVCLRTCKCWYPWSLDEGARFPGTVVTGSCEMSCGYQGPNQALSQSHFSGLDCGRVCLCTHELQVTVSCQMSVLEIKFGFPAITVQTFKEGRHHEKDNKLWIKRLYMLKIVTRDRCGGACL